MKGKFNKNRFDRPLANRAEATAFAVIDVPFGEREGGQKAEIEIIPDFEIGDNAEVETRPLQGLDRADTVAEQELPGPEGLVVGGVDSKRNPKIISFAVELLEIVVAGVVFLSQQANAAQAAEEQGQYYFELA